eukprot:4196220-Prymnesium_polylepis.2
MGRRSRRGLAGGTSLVRLRLLPHPSHASSRCRRHPCAHVWAYRRRVSRMNRACHVLASYHYHTFDRVARAAPLLLPPVRPCLGCPRPRVPVRGGDSECIATKSKAHVINDGASGVRGTIESGRVPVQLYPDQTTAACAQRPEGPPDPRASHPQS